MMKRDFKQTVIKLEAIPKPFKAYHAVKLMEIMLPEEDPDGKPEILSLVYTWNVEEGDKRVLAWIEDSFREVGEANNLSKALELALKDVAEMMDWQYLKGIKVVE